MDQSFYYSLAHSLFRRDRNGITILHIGHRQTPATCEADLAKHVSSRLHVLHVSPRIIPSRDNQSIILNRELPDKLKRNVFVHLETIRIARRCCNRSWITATRRRVRETNAWKHCSISTRILTITSILWRSPSACAGQSRKSDILN